MAHRNQTTYFNPNHNLTRAYIIPAFLITALSSKGLQFISSVWHRLRVAAGAIQWEIFGLASKSGSSSNKTIFLPCRP